jgi:hypothetical protein
MMSHVLILLGISVFLLVIIGKYTKESGNPINRPLLFSKYPIIFSLYIILSTIGSIISGVLIITLCIKVSWWKPLILWGLIHFLSFQFEPPFSFYSKFRYTLYLFLVNIGIFFIPILVYKMILSILALW